MIKLTNTPYQLFTTITILSIIIIIQSKTFLISWFSIEANLLSILPILKIESRSTQIETITKYYIIQSVGSHGILLRALLIAWVNLLTIYMILLRLLIKIGSAPTHQWTPPLFHSQSWTIILILSSTQKIGPLLILTTFTITWLPIASYTIIIINLMIGSLGGINQTSPKTLMAYSSINNIGWILLILHIPKDILLPFFTLYMLNITIIFNTIEQKTARSTTQPLLPTNEPIHSNSTTSLFILSLWGAPPTPGFFGKILILIPSTSYNIFLSSILIFTAFLTLFYYINLYIILETAAIKTKNQLNQIPTFSLLLIRLLLLSFTI